jgi:hypothetical protein
MRLQCQVCGQRCSSSSGLTRHIKACHQDIGSSRATHTTGWALPQRSDGGQERRASIETGSALEEDTAFGGEEPIFDAEEATDEPGAVPEDALAVDGSRRRTPTNGGQSLSDDAGLWFGPAAPVAASAFDERERANPFFPFRNREEFEFAEWTRDGQKIPDHRINKLLEMFRNPAFNTRNIGFTNANGMWTRADQLVASFAESEGMEFRLSVLKTEGPTECSWANKEVPFYHRSPLDVIRHLFGRLDLEVQLKAQREYNDNNERLYNEPWTGDRWERIQVSGLGCRTLAPETRVLI